MPRTPPAPTMRDAAERLVAWRRRRRLDRKRRLGPFHLPHETAKGAAFVTLLVASQIPFLSAWSPLAGWTDTVAYAGCAIAAVDLAIVLTWAWRRRAAAAEHRIARETAACALSVSGAFLAAGIAMRIAGFTHYAESDRIRWIAVTPDRTGLVLVSDVKAGYGDRVVGLLEANPGVRTVHLLSFGGLLNEAAKVADAIRGRGIDTVAIGPCYSACTYIHAAGRRRLIEDGAGASLGYHSGGHLFLPSGWNWVGRGPWDIFLRAGYGPEFVERLRTVPYHDMWEPDRRTLFENGAITGEVSSYDTIGLRWLTAGGSRTAPLFDTWEGRVVGVSPAAKAAIGDWAQAAWDAARNRRRIDGYLLSYFHRIVALGLSMPEAPDHAVRRATDYLLAGMYAARDHDKAEGERSCARIGAALDFSRAARLAPTPPGAGSDPSDPWGAFLARALSGLPGGWESAAAGLPDVEAAGTWSAPRPGPYPACSEFTRWFEAALADGGDGIARIRERFRRFATTPSNGMPPDERGKAVSASLR